MLKISIGRVIIAHPGKKQGGASKLSLLTHRLFGGDGVAEIVDFATPSKRVKELFQENFGDF